jgi:hypothetical protein
MLCQRDCDALEPDMEYRQLPVSQPGSERGLEPSNLFLTYLSRVDIKLDLYSIDTRNSCVHHNS